MAFYYSLLVVMPRYLVAAPLVGRHIWLIPRRHPKQDRPPRRIKGSGFIGGLSYLRAPTGDLPDGCYKKLDIRKEGTLLKEALPPRKLHEL